MAKIALKIVFKSKRFSHKISYKWTAPIDRTRWITVTFILHQLGDRKLVGLGFLGVAVCLVLAHLLPHHEGKLNASGLVELLL